jgi:hypothetical protein
MSATYATPVLQRSLAAVYRFYDAFLFPLDDRTPPIVSPLDVSIPAFGWTALPAQSDATYRFSALTLRRAAPTGINLAVQVSAPDGDYSSLNPILLSLPRPISTPPRRSDFLIAQPLWPTPAFRPPTGETAVRGGIFSLAAAPVADLDVEIWPGAAPVPPAGTPVTRSDGNGEFLYRLPMLKGSSGASVPARIRLSGGAVAVTPAVLPIVIGETQIIRLQRM